MDVVDVSGFGEASLAGVKLPPNPLTSTTSIPDQYLADGGIAYPVPKIRGMAAKFGMRYEGVKVRDLIGGRVGFRRPRDALSVEPGGRNPTRKNTPALHTHTPVRTDTQRPRPRQ